MSQAAPDLQMLANLLQIEQDLRQADSLSAVEFIAVNDSWRIAPYRQACLWRLDAQQRPRLRLVSGLADVGGDSPFRQWLEEVWLHLAKDDPGLQKIHALRRPDLPVHLQPGWMEWMAEYVLCLPLPAPSGGAQAGLWLSFEQEPGEAEMALLQRLALAYGHAMWAWRAMPGWWRQTWAKVRRRHKLVALALLLVCCIPMRLSALAPAEIIGRDAKLIAAPADGVVAQFFVTPNAQVKTGMPLFALDDTSARNRLEVANKARAVAEADYLRATQKSFSDMASKSELASLKAKLEERSAELQFTRDLLARIQVHAPENGVVVFSDPNDWLGRPVQTGERIMSLADPARVQVMIHLPVDDILKLEDDAQVKLYLNVDPLHALHAHLVQASYEPVAGSDGVVAYQLRADLESGQSLPRIGWKGTAKVYGQWAPLIYHVLRKPLAAVRRSLGV